MNTLVYVPAPFLALGREEWVDVPTGEMKPRKFGRGEKEITRKEKRWVQTGISDKKIDGEAFAKAIQVSVQQLNNEGYEVVTMTMTTSGEYDWSSKSAGLEGTGGGYGWGYGFSYTSGANIIARKIA